MSPHLCSSSVRAAAGNGNQSRPTSAPCDLTRQLWIPSFALLFSHYKNRSVSLIFSFYQETHTARTQSKVLILPSTLSLALL
jgi:hypothetical protein